MTLNILVRVRSSTQGPFLVSVDLFNVTSCNELARIINFIMLGLRAVLRTCMIWLLIFNSSNNNITCELL